MKPLNINEKQILTKLVTELNLESISIPLEQNKENSNNSIISPHSPKLAIAYGKIIQIFEENDLTIKEVGSIACTIILEALVKLQNDTLAYYLLRKYFEIISTIYNRKLYK